MAKLKIAAIEDAKQRKATYKRRAQGLIKKVQQLTILCNMAACLVMFNHDDQKLTLWPSLDEAKSLIEKFFSLSSHERNMKAVNQESLITRDIKLTEKKLDNARSVIKDIENDSLLLQLQTAARRSVDFSDTEVENLMTYIQQKIKSFAKEIGSRNTSNARSVNQGSLPGESSKTVHKFDLNLEPSDSEDHEETQNDA